MPPKRYAMSKGPFLASPSAKSVYPQRFDFAEGEASGAKSKGPSAWAAKGAVVEPEGSQRRPKFSFYKNPTAFSYKGKIKFRHNATSPLGLPMVLFVDRFCRIVGMVLLGFAFGKAKAPPRR